ncbi:hypothetical protein AB205_0004190, partial [Aquarana catesbeiana]
ELEKIGLGDVDLHVYEVPVEYQTVQRLIPDLWMTYNPEELEHRSKSVTAPVWTPLPVMLCEWEHSQGKSVFIHVPPLGKPYTASQLGRALQTILNIILDMLEQSEDEITCHQNH